jgi:hypothetical protein
MESSLQVDPNILNLNILFDSMINMIMFFDFVTITFRNHMFKMCLSRFIKIEVDATIDNVSCK